MNKIVRATAGAGKTTGLLEAVYSAYKSSYLSSGSYPKILLSTFTVKAANELTERLTKKAIEEKDAQFLNFVSSGFLEVGTLHSVFLKIFGDLQSDLSKDGQKFMSQSVKKQIGRSYFHEVLKETKSEEFLKESRQETDALDLFWHLYSYSYKNIQSPKSEEMFQSVREELKTYFKELNLKISIESVYEDLELENTLDLIEASADKDLKKKKVYKDLVKFCKAPKNSKEFILEYEYINNLLLTLYLDWKEKIDQYFEEMDVFDANDIEVKLLEKLKTVQFDEQIWDFCFFDEYQDTSPIQKDILSIVSGRSVNYFVGDPFQSIYFFRGARKAIFLNEFSKIESSGGSTEYRLNNYRSANDIVEFSNGVIKSLVPDFIDMQPFNVDLKGEISVAYFEEGELKDELEYVATKLQNKDYTKESAAVLCRSAKELLLLARILKSKGVNFRLALSKGFESALETIELSHLLKFIWNVEDDESLLNLLFSHWVNISHSEIQEAVLKNKDDKKSLWTYFKDHEGVVHLKNLINNSKLMNCSNAVIDFLGESGFLGFSDALDQSGVRERNILKFLGALVAEEKKENFNLLSFSDDILRGYYRFESEDLSSDSGVTLMTVHGSKGLQFDDVFLINTNKPNRGSAKSFYFDLDSHFFAIKVKNDLTSKYIHSHFIEKMIESEKNEESAERKRLLYVGMTRAKKNLTFTGSKKLPKDSKDPAWLESLIRFLEKSEQLEYLEDLESSEVIGQTLESPKILIGGFLENTENLGFANKNFQGVTQNLHDQEGRMENKRDLKLFSSAIADGVLFHELLEKAKDEGDAQRLIPVFFENRNLKKHSEAIEYLFSQKDFPFETLFREGFKEWGFDTSGEKGRSGKIDLWALIENEIWIVDYKTGALDNLEKGFEQLTAYKEVLKDFCQIKKPVFKMVLVFPYKKKAFIRC